MNHRTATLTLIVWTVVAAWSPAAGADPSPATAQEITRWPPLSRCIDGLYADHDQPHTPGGVVAVIHRGEVIHLKGYGAANREFDVRWTPATRYRIASMTKSFVAHALLLLEEQGRLKLDDPLEVHLPDFPQFDPPHRLRHLVTMTSGLWQDEFLLGLADVRGRVTLDEMYALSKRQPRLNYAPGSATSYVDTNFRLLARVIAAAAGKPFSQAMDELIFAPLGMEATLVAPDLSRYYRHQAPTYLVDDDDDADLVFWLSLPTSGDGAIITTMSDLVRWLRHLRAEDGTPAPILERMIAPFELNDGTPALYRRGIYQVLHRRRGLRGWGHGGVTGTHYIVWPALDLIVANFTNALTRIRASSMSLAITDCVLDWDPRLLDPSSVIPPPEWPEERERELLSGIFVEPNAGYVLFSEPGDELLRHSLLGTSMVLARTGEGRFEALPRFFSSGFEVRFAKGGDEARPDLLVTQADWPEPRRFVRVTPPEPAEVPVADYTGTYRSPALGVHYTVEEDDGGLVLHIGAGIEAGQVLTLEGVMRDVFLARFREREALEGLILPGLVSIRFFRDPEGRVRTMQLSINEIRDLVFNRVCECGQPR